MNPYVDDKSDLDQRMMRPSRILQALSPELASESDWPAARWRASPTRSGARPKTSISAPFTASAPPAWWSRCGRITGSSLASPTPIAGFASLYPVMIAHRRDYASVCQARGRIVIGPDWREGRGRIVPLDRLPKDQSTMTCAYSYPIQGICSDICMKALTEVDRLLLRESIDGHLVGWIRDELLVETREADVDRVKALLQSEMERAFIDTFPAATRNKLIEVKVAPNWAAIKEKEKKP
jgi:hypothetical protein